MFDLSSHAENRWQIKCFTRYYLNYYFGDFDKKKTIIYKVV